MANTEPVRVTILNQTYTLVSNDESGGVHELAQTVDELMRTISRSGNLDTTRTAVLACIHLADQLRSLQRDYEGLKHSVDAKAKELDQLLATVLGN